MSESYGKSEIVDQLQQVQRGVSDTVQAMPSDNFYRGTEQSWSASDYLKHLLLAVKPFAKGLTYSPEQIKAMFGAPDHPSRTYIALVAAYQSRLNEGIRAEDYPNITPVTYRMPEGVAAADVQNYLVQTWNDAHTKLYEGLDHWSEVDLDTCQFQHAALGLLTAREVLFFTIYHNTLHWNDIRLAGA